MVEYEKKKVLYSFIGVFKNPKMHCLDSLGWVMVEFMYAQVISLIMVVVPIGNHVALTCDEVSMVDNGNWISIHAYLMQYWVKIPMLISLQKVVDGIGVVNLIVVIMEALQKAKGLSSKFVVQKPLCFGDDGVSIFQGTKTWVIKQININYASFSISVHYMVHRCNLAFKTLSSLGIMKSIKYMLQTYHSYFAHNPNKHLKFIKLIEMMEIKVLKMFKNVKT